MIIVDGMLLARRCHAKMDFLKNSKGVSTGMEYGFLKTLKSISAKLQDDEIVICWDSKQSFRKRLDPQYKANRLGSGTKLGEEWWERLNTMKRMLTHLHRGCWEPTFEADDIMASITKVYKIYRKKIFIYSNDKDLLQAVSDNVYLVTSRDSQLWLWDEEEVLKEFGVSRIEYMYWKAFLGDGSDNVKGVSVKKKTLISKLLESKGLPIEKVVATLYDEEGWTKKEFAKILDFSIQRFILNIELVKLRILDRWTDIEKCSKHAFDKYLQELEIRSLQYDDQEF